MPGNLGIQAAAIAAPVTLLASTPALVLAAPPVPATAATPHVIVAAFARLELAADATGVRLTLHRGADAAAPVLRAGPIVAGAGGAVVDALLWELDADADAELDTYAVSAAQLDAASNGTVLRAGLIVAVVV